MKTNNIHHKDCPLSDKAKLRMILHGENCSQFIDNDVFGIENTAKLRPIDPERSPYYQSWEEHFINICMACSKNTPIWGYSGQGSNFGQSGNGIEMTDKPGFFQKLWNIIKILWNK